jgi:hypothetical protein
MIALPHYLSAVITCWLLAAATAAPDQQPRVIVVLVEGFGNWLLDEHDLHNSVQGFRQLQMNGVRADYLLPEFFTESAPNFYSLFTGALIGRSIYTTVPGVHPDTHHVYSDVYYNAHTFYEVFNKHTRTYNTSAFLPVNNQTRFVWDRLPPLHVSLHNWRTCSKVRVCIHTRAYCVQHVMSVLHECIPYMPVRDDYESIMTNILHEMSEFNVRLSMLTIGDVATAARAYGPQSTHTRHAIERVSGYLHRLQVRHMFTQMSNRLPENAYRFLDVVNNVAIGRQRSRSGGDESREVCILR